MHHTEMIARNRGYSIPGFLEINSGEQLKFPAFLLCKNVSKISEVFSEKQFLSRNSRNEVAFLVINFLSRMKNYPRVCSNLRNPPPQHLFPYSKTTQKKKHRNKCGHSYCIVHHFFEHFLVLSVCKPLFETMFFIGFRLIFPNF